MTPEDFLLPLWMLVGAGAVEAAYAHHGERGLSELLKQTHDLLTEKGIPSFGAKFLTILGIGWDLIVWPLTVYATVLAARARRAAGDTSRLAETRKSSNK